jgi:acetylornithine deacetylase/succinyl-diaminopimelate desuccinylase-like protein
VAVHLAALRAHADGLPVGVTVLVEGEEEIGSPALPGFLDAFSGALRADVVVFADAGNWTEDIPALTTSLRGGTSVVVEVRTLRHGVHSGMYGGPAPDALTALCRMLASLHDERGVVAVPGLTRGSAGYGGADPLDLTEEQFRDEAGMLDGVRLTGTGGLTARLWAGPAITVIGIDAPSVAAASNTLIPWASETTRSSSGFHRSRSPRNAGSEEPAITGFPVAVTSCVRRYERRSRVPAPVLPVQSRLTW